MPAGDESDTGPQPVVDPADLRPSNTPAYSAPDASAPGPTVATSVADAAAEPAATPAARTGAPAGTAPTGTTPPTDAADRDEAPPVTHSAAAGEPEDQGRTVVLRTPLAGTEEPSGEDQRRS
jgi:hypothetical protein